MGEGWQEGGKMGGRWENKSGQQVLSGKWRGKGGIDVTDGVGVGIKDERWMSVHTYGGVW